MSNFHMSINVKDGIISTYITLFWHSDNSYQATISKRKGDNSYQATTPINFK